ncbi:MULTISPECIES: sensor histidine kinase [Luteibacter]|uniref:sensor histidine kinase n=1 Tax=Luteibacter TaxID=242605 RepID=UPI00068F8AAB|nr:MULTISPECIES: sensor histidine kinase [unclassified Luteibacter]
MTPRLSSDTRMARSWLTPAPDSLWNRFRDKPRLRVASLFHLVWTVYVFGDLAFARTLSPHWWLVTATSFPVFLGLYALCYTRSLRWSPWLGGAAALLGFAVMGVNASAGGCYVIYACAMVGFDGSPKRSFSGMGGVLGAFVLVGWYVYSWPPAIIAGITFIALCVGSINVIYRYNAQRDAELKLSHDEVRRLAAMAERERIGRDLHDLLGHTLSLITLKLELSRRLLDKDEAAARREMEEAERVARHALAEVRSAVTGIRASGIAAELASARLLLNASMVGFEYTTELPVLSERIEAELALVLREAVTNVHRHARASIAEARVEVHGKELLLTVIDDGKGGVSDEGNGICGMRERVRKLGGTLSFESARGAGTRVRITVPLNPGDRLVTPPRGELPGALPGNQRLAS